MTESEEIVDFEYGQMVKVVTKHSVFYDRRGRIAGEYWQYEDDKTYMVRLVEDSEGRAVSFHQSELREVN